MNTAPYLDTQIRALELSRPSIRVIINNSVPRDQTVILSESAGGPAIAASCYMVIEMKNIFRGGRRIDPEQWFADIMEQIEKDIELSTAHAMARLTA